MGKTCVGLIGAGNWGQKLLCAFDKVSKVKYFSNKSNLELHEKLKEKYPHITPTLNYKEILKDKEVEAVIISTPIKTHYPIAKEALSHNKHVFIEKPLCNTVEEGKELINIAKSKDLTSFVGHIFLYEPAYNYLKKLVNISDIEKICFYWDKFGTFNEGLIENLISHDVAITLDLLKKSPQKTTILNKLGVISDIDILSIKLNFYEGKEVYINVNRVNPIKTKSMFIKTKNNDFYAWVNKEIYHLKKDSFKKIYESKKNALSIECLEFINSIKNKTKPLSDGVSGLKVLETLEKIKCEN